MSINKITNAPTPNEHIAKTNEVVDFCNNLVMPTVGNGTITITQGGTTKGSFTTNQSGNSTIDLDSGSGSGSSRNIGEIIQSTIPLTDAGLHLLDGSRIYEGGVYDDFFQYMEGLYNTPLYAWHYPSSSTSLDVTTIYTLSQSPTVGDPVFAEVDGVITNIKNLVDHSDRTVGDFALKEELPNNTISYYYSSITAYYSFFRDTSLDTTYHPEYFCSENDWQTSVANYGVCGKFVYDVTNNTVRLPKVTGFTESEIDIAAVGDLTEAGLPDHIHTGQYKNPGTSGGNANGVGSGSGWFGWANRNTDAASVHNSIYGNSDTVQPQSIKVLYYIVVANSTKTEIEVDIDNVITDLNSKLNRDLSNISNSSKELITDWCVPDYKNAITIANNTNLNTAEDNGFIILNLFLTSSGSGYLQINGINVAVSYRSSSYASPCSGVFPVSKGDTFKITTTNHSTYGIYMFAPAKGIE